MRKEFVYSFMALGAIPVTVNAAGVEAVKLNTSYASTDGNALEVKAGKLQPGKYTFTSSLTSKVYDVKVEIGGESANVTAGTNQSVTINFELKAETEVTLKVTSSGAGVSGSEFTVGSPLLNLQFDFSVAKNSLTSLATTLKNTINGYSYEAKEDDVKTADAILKKVEDIKDNYDDYTKYKLYNVGSEEANSTIEDEIDQLANSSKASEDAYWNNQAYNRVNDAITAIKTLFSQASTDINAALVAEAAYLLPDAQDELKDIDAKITEAIKKSYSSKQAGTAVADEATNMAAIPTEKEINDIKSKYTTQAEANKAAYKALADQVAVLNTNIGKVVITEGADADGKLAAEKAEAQKAIDAIDTKVKAVQNTAEQLTLNISADVTAAQGKIDAVSAKVTTANNEFEANESTIAMIAELQKAFDEAKAEVAKATSKDGKYKGDGEYYTQYLEDVQKDINTLKEDAAKAYKEGKAVDYNNNLKALSEEVEKETAAYLEEAVKAVEYYDELQECIATYKKSLEDARAEFENLPIYNDEKYDFKTEFDKLLKEINDIQAAIDAAFKLGGEEHWKAILTIDKNDDENTGIEADIEKLLEQKYAAMNAYDIDGLNGGIADLESRIAAFKTDYATTEATMLGADYQAFAELETAIEAAVAAEKATVGAIDKTSEDAPAAILTSGKSITLLTVKQDQLEAVAKVVAEKVAANTTSKSNLTKGINALNESISKFETEYKLGQATSTLGLRGQADGDVTKAENEIKTAIGTLQTANNAVVPTSVALVDNTEKVGTTAASWPTVDIAHEGPEARTTTLDGVTMVEQWCDASKNDQIGIVLTQKLTGLANGVYEVEVYASAVDQSAGNPNNGKTDIALVYANDAENPVTVTTNYTLNTYKLTALVSDGTLEMGLKKVKAGTNWHTIQIKSLTFHDNTQDFTESQKAFEALSKQQADLEASAPDIAKSVAGNKTKYAAVNKEMASLKTYIADKLKDDASVNLIIKADGTFSGNAKQTIYEANDFVLYRTELEKDYPTLRSEMLADTTALRNAIEAAYAAETLAEQWNNGSITVGEGDKAKTYTIADIKAAVDNIRATAETEQTNWYGYRHIRSNGKNDVGTTNGVNDTQLTAAFTAARKDLGTATGAEAEAYYTDLLNSYENDELAAIRLRMFNSLKARTAVKDQAGYISELKALKAKIEAVQNDAKANLEKYTAQKKALEETSTLWNDTYVTIAATDASTTRDNYLALLDEVKKTIDQAQTGDASVESNYKSGTAVANAYDFDALKNKINDIKAQQTEGYNKQIAADNATRYDNALKAIDILKQAYKAAIDYRNSNRGSNESLNEQINSQAQTTIDKVLYDEDMAKQIKDFEDNVKKVYSETTSPTLFDEENQYVADALGLQKQITDAQEAFQKQITDIIKGWWDSNKTNFNLKLTSAKSDISSYSEAAQKDAFKDIETLVEAGDKAATEPNLSEVEAIFAQLDENFDSMLAADKNEAAKKDLDPRFEEADTKYANAKAKIENVSETLLGDNLEKLNTSYTDNVEAAKETKNTAYGEQTLPNSYNDIMVKLNQFLAESTACVGNVEAAVANDVANTQAYEAMLDIIGDVRAQLTIATGLHNQYKYAEKYAPNFQSIATALDNLEQNALRYKEQGTAVNDLIGIEGGADGQERNIFNYLYFDFNHNKEKLANDIDSIKVQYNTFAADIDKADQAAKYRAEIEALTETLNKIQILSYTDHTSRDIMYTSTRELLEIQGNIADLRARLTKENNAALSAELYAAFNDRVAELKELAAYEGKADWATAKSMETSYNNGQNKTQTIKEWLDYMAEEIAAKKQGIDDNSDNLAFYKEKYDGELDAIQTTLDAVTSRLNTYQAQWDANEAAYTRLTTEIAELNASINAALDKVKGYEWAGTRFGDEETPGIESELNQYIDRDKGATDNAYQDVTLTEDSQLANKETIENSITNFLNTYAYQDIFNLIRYGYGDVLSLQKYLRQKYSTLVDLNNNEKFTANAYNALLAEYSNINAGITDLYDENDYSNRPDKYVKDEDGNWVRIPVLDEEGNLIGFEKEIDSDANHAGYYERVQAIRSRIDALELALQESQMGDLNADGAVTTNDYTQIIDIIVGNVEKPEPASSKFRAADINGDEDITVVDATQLVNIILFDNPEGDENMRRASSVNNGPVATAELDTTNESLSLTAVSRKGNMVRMALLLDNENTYSNMQLDLVLPAGMTLAGQSAAGRTTDSHGIYSGKADGVDRILLMSAANEAIKEGSGVLMYIDVEIGSGYTGGDITLGCAIFTDAKGNYAKFSSFNGGNPTGIESIETNDSWSGKIYNLGGRMVNAVKKGINIIRNADGSTKKVIKK